MTRAYRLALLRALLREKVISLEEYHALLRR